MLILGRAPFLETGATEEVAIVKEAISVINHLCNFMLDVLLSPFVET